MKKEFVEQIKQKNLEINKTLDQVESILNTITPKADKYVLIDVCGVEALETQLNQFNDAGYELKFLVLGDINNSFVATLYADNPRAANTTGASVSTKYRVISSLGSQAFGIKANFLSDTGYKMVAQVKSGRDIVAVFAK